jgi:hypothetical protein
MSRGRTWLWRLFLLGFVAIVTVGLWPPPIISRAVEKDCEFPEVAIDATVLPNGDLHLEETRTFDFGNGPFTYAYFNVDDPNAHVRDFTISERLDGDPGSGSTGGRVLELVQGFSSGEFSGGCGGGGGGTGGGAG